MDDQERELAKEVGRQYWGTTKSVREVCESLDVTSATLYRLLQPLATGEACAACGGALGFKNRTARDAGEATCAECGAVEWVRRAHAGTGAAKGAEGKPGGAKGAGDRAGGAPGDADAAAGNGRPSDPDWVSDAVDDALASTEKVFREVVVVAAGLVAVLAVGVVGFLSRRRG